jgi:hypothetical protein
LFQEGLNVSCLLEEAKKRNLTFREFTPGPNLNKLFFFFVSGDGPNKLECLTREN